MFRLLLLNDDTRTLVDFRRGPLGPHFDEFAAYPKTKKYSHDFCRSVFGKCCQFNWFLIERGIVSAKEIRTSFRGFQTFTP